MLAELVSLTKIVTPVVAATWVAWRYIEAKKEKDREDAKEAVQRAETRRIESRKPFLELKLRIYVEVTQVVGKLVAIGIGSDEWDSSEARFWSLYWSELAMVESEHIEEIMMALGDAVKKCHQNYEDGKSDLRYWSYGLAHQIRAEILTDWSSEPIVIADGQKRLQGVSAPRSPSSAAE